MRPLVIGHRGAPGYLPEHTRASYELAIAHGVDAVEPDVVPSRDGVLVVRHENEISTTTDVADRPEFAHLRRTRSFAGVELTGWFTEDFTWEQLSTLRCRERLPHLRPGSAAHDDEQPMLRLTDLLDLLDAAGRDIRLVLEVKHAAYFATIGLDPASLVSDAIRSAGWWGDAERLVVESFEPTVLAELRAAGLPATFVQLVEAEGAPVDLLLARGAAAPTYREMISPSGLERLADEVEGISLDKAIVLGDAGARLVADAHARGLLVYAWTARPENRFLESRFRRGEDPARFGDYAAEWTRMRDAGIDGVFVDHPDLGAAAFGRP
ncbi:glycerophosphodiester phosphodiesterase family protein [Microbacterium sp. SORGH_AS_0888]|uniref:glycerophosphodiester phosphodiesterase family protein n=1 Tax=Microbacterium sp. SORGH_AS_0888 TaxID=3041791 RepID=UPI00277EC183|nr:glycerophosphodiester phosphodiesterase family protein [Microbacterium sp. SORGH_AS_0888]MDQ1129228.1 glycerophosphoryl diester phosphodiesterase [Microbacterium sp. SORGH_AS_0888]